MTNFDENNTEERVRIRSNDEIGEIASVYNETAKRINNLIIELRMYSSQLQSIVDARTKSLARVNRLQKAMTDSLDQGFIMFTNSLKIMETVTRAATDHLNKNLGGKKYYSGVRDKGERCKNYKTTF